MTKKIGNVLYVVGIVFSIPFVILVGASVMRMFSEGLETKYVNSAFLGLFGAVFSYAVGYLLRDMVFEYADRS